MNELINHILYIAHKNNKTITQLQLHKIAYFVLGMVIQSNEQLGKEMYQEQQFKAWNYGPVLPKIYEKYKKYNSLPILSKGKKSDRLNDLKGLNEFIDELLDMNVFYLVEISHNHKFWKENIRQIRNRKGPTYSFEDMVEIFK